MDCLVSREDFTSAINDVLESLGDSDYSIDESDDNNSSKAEGKD